jgi:hypothetical protein
MSVPLPDELKRLCFIRSVNRVAGLKAGLLR